MCNDIDIKDLSTGDIAVWSPYSRRFVDEAHDLDGHWNRDDECWEFDGRDRERVEDLLHRVYGWNPEGTPTFDIRITGDEVPEDGNELVLLEDRVLAVRRFRDGKPRLTRGVIIADGRFPYSGGSHANPRVDAGSGVTLEVRGLTAEDIREMHELEYEFEIVRGDTALLDCPATPKPEPADTADAPADEPAELPEAARAALDRWSIGDPAGEPAVEPAETVVCAASTPGAPTLRLAVDEFDVAQATPEAEAVAMTIRAFDSTPMEDTEDGVEVRWSGNPAAGTAMPRTIRIRHIDLGRWAVQLPYRKPALRATLEAMPGVIRMRGLFYHIEPESLLPFAHAVRAAMPGVVVMAGTREQLMEAREAAAALTRRLAGDDLNVSDSTEEVNDNDNEGESVRDSAAGSGAGHQPRGGEMPAREHGADDRLAGETVGRGRVLGAPMGEGPADAGGPASRPAGPAEDVRRDGGPSVRVDGGRGASGPIGAPCGRPGFDDAGRMGAGDRASGAQPDELPYRMEGGDGMSDVFDELDDDWTDEDGYDRDGWRVERDPIPAEAEEPWVDVTGEPGAESMPYEDLFEYTRNQDWSLLGLTDAGGRFVMTEIEYRLCRRVNRDGESGGSFWESTGLEADIAGLLEAHPEFDLENVPDVDAIVWGLSDGPDWDADGVNLWRDVITADADAASAIVHRDAEDRSRGTALVAWYEDGETHVELIRARRAPYTPHRWSLDWRTRLELASAPLGGGTEEIARAAAETLADVDRAAWHLDD